jgi:hypothetical protein
MWTTVLLTAAIFVSTEVQVNLLQGDPVAGSISALNSQEITLTGKGGDTQHALDQLQSIVFAQQAAPAKNATTLITLHDGSSFHAKSITLTGEKCTLVIGETQSFICRADSIRDIQFKSLTDEALQQYQQIIAADSAEDILIVQRQSGAIDQLEGIVEAIDGKVVTFNFDGDKIPVEITKLAGIRLVKPANKQTSKSLCRITDTLNNIWQVSQLKLVAENQELQVKTCTGESLTLNLSELHRLDFASNNILYLSDIIPEAVEWTPFLSGNLIRKRLSKVYEPHLDISIDGTPLMVGTESYSKGISIHSRTVMSLRLPDTYSKLQMDIGIDPATNGRGHVDLTILGDNKQLFQDSVAGSDKPRTLDINIVGVRRITIKVDYGKNLDIGDQLNMGDARVLK